MFGIEILGVNLTDNIRYFDITMDKWYQSQGAFINAINLKL